MFLNLLIQYSYAVTNIIKLLYSLREKLKKSILSTALST